MHKIGSAYSLSSLDVLRRSLTNDPSENYIDATVDNIIFGELGNALSRTQIEKGYVSQPWS